MQETVKIFILPNIYSEKKYQWNKSKISLSNNWWVQRSQNHSKELGNKKGDSWSFADWLKEKNYHWLGGGTRVDQECKNGWIMHREERVS